jgi:hypothetical protein
VKALEDKVGSLLALLDPAKAKKACDVYHARTPAPTEPSESATSPALTQVRTGPSVTRSPAADSTRADFDVIDSGLISIGLSDILLTKYKRVHSTFFPFVIIAPEVDALTCRRETPFTFLAIVTACIEDDHMLQRRLGKELRRLLCERVVMSCERNLDLLQGLLVMLGWNHFHFNPAQKRMHMTLQFALTLMMDLELDRCPAHRDQRVGSHMCSLSINKIWQNECRRSTAEIRALMGLFYLCSS